MLMNGNQGILKNVPDSSVKATSPQDFRLEFERLFNSRWSNFNPVDSENYNNHGSRCILATKKAFNIYGWIFSLNESIMCSRIGWVCRRYR
jgi:hypothetical protein